MRKTLVILLCLMAVPAIVWAQSDCENMLQAANQYYSNGQYDKAARMYQLIKEECGSNYGGVESKLTDCNNKIQEDAAYNQCNTVEACDAYLRNYPNGRYVQSVQQKRNSLLAARNEAEDRAYANCNDIAGCQNYLRAYPNGRYVTQVRNKLAALQGGQGGSQGGGNYGGGNYGGGSYGGTSSGDRNNNNNNNNNNYNSGNLSSGSTDNNSNPNRGGVGIRSGNWIAALKKCMNNPTKYYDRGSYKGQLSNGTLSGLGIYWWNDGDFYIGKYSEGVRNGMGIYFMEQGTFRGCPNCVCYVGNWLNGKKSGTGTCYDQYGNLVYYGQFSDDNPTGTYPTSGYTSYKFEIKEYTNGCFYIGETKNGERHGVGIYVWTDGSIWYGNWSEGERHGYGIYMPNQGSVSTGRWNGDERE